MTKSKTYFDSYMYPFLSAMTEGRQLQYVSPPSCGSVTHSFAGNLFSSLFGALSGFGQQSNTLCSLFGCGNNGYAGGLSGIDDNTDAFKPFSTSGSNTVWNGSGDDSYTDSILANSSLSSNGIGSSIANSMSAIMGGNDDGDSSGRALGSFSNSCIDMTYQGDSLQMKCGDGKGSYYPTSISKSQIDKCANNGDEIRNMNGAIECGDYTSNKGSATKVSGSEYPWCSSGVSTSGGWGWENNQSCRADPSKSSKDWKTSEGGYTAGDKGDSYGGHSCSDQKSGMGANLTG